MAIFAVLEMPSILKTECKFLTGALESCRAGPFAPYSATVFLGSDSMFWNLAQAQQRSTSFPALAADGSSELVEAKKSKNLPAALIWCRS